MESLLVCIATLALPFVSALILRSMRWHKFHNAIGSSKHSRAAVTQEQHKSAGPLRLSPAATIAYRHHQELMKLAAIVRELDESHNNLRYADVSHSNANADSKTYLVTAEEIARFRQSLDVLLTHATAAKGPAYRLQEVSAENIAAD